MQVLEEWEVDHKLSELDHKSFEPTHDLFLKRILYFPSFLYAI
ncbi:hypothetical protein [Bacillus methanolicus]|nr:hypothetical protein [Bacillus methanolicus]